MTKVLLFDIDGTLVDTGGAGLRAFARILNDEFGTSEALLGIPLAGRTDRAILADALARVAPDHEADESWLLEFSERYVAALAEELQVASARRRLLPGVLEALDHAASLDGVHLALLTGNFRKGAEVKLGHFGIWDRFAFGAYGDDSADRNDLFPVAMARAREAGVAVRDARDVVIIGDTPHDVACARSGGALAVGVTTGPYDRAALEGAGADVVIDDLTRFAQLREVFA
jgi:phosphoglycolate phosphatase-like HAD superfamily hydrolase